MRKPVPLDLNNLPADDYSAIHHDHKQPPHLLHFHHSSASSSSSTAAADLGKSYRKKKNGGKNESRKVYECRFCSLKFCKSQALGGHMNRHRQERETETLSRARQLVFGNHNPSYQLQLGIGQPMVHRGYHNQAECNMGSRLYTTRLFSTNSTALLQPVAPCLSLPSILTIPNASRHPKSYESGNDYFLGPVCSRNPQFILQNLSNTPPPDGTNNYTCIGAPVIGRSGE